MKKKILSKRKVSLRKDNKNPKRWLLWKRFTMKPKKVTRVASEMKLVSKSSRNLLIKAIRS